MRRRTKVGIALLAMACLVLVLRGPIYRLVVTYEPLRERQAIELRNEILMEELGQKLIHKKPDEIREMVDVALGISNGHLHFVSHQAPTDPNQFSDPSCEANCVGYAALTASLLNQLFVLQGQEGRFVARHLVGKMRILGFDVHALFSSPFFADHDYVSITDRTTGQQYHVDPTVSDYLRIRFVTSD